MFKLHPTCMCILLCYLSLYVCCTDWHRLCWNRTYTIWGCYVYMMFFPWILYILSLCSCSRNQVSSLPTLKHQRESIRYMHAYSFLTILTDVIIRSYLYLDYCIGIQDEIATKRVKVCSIICILISAFTTILYMYNYRWNSQNVLSWSKDMVFFWRGSK